MAGSGGVVTAAGLVFAVTMASMLGSDLRIIAQLGSTIAIGLLLDTLIVRSLLMPSIATLLGRWFWWPRHLPPRRLHHAPDLAADRLDARDGPVEAKHLLVHGVLGAVGSLAVQLTRWGVGSGDRNRAPHHGHRQRGHRGRKICCRLDKPDAAAQVRALAPNGVDRIVEISRQATPISTPRSWPIQAIIAAYASCADRPAISFWRCCSPR